jgi:hypothetical protein
MGPNLEQIKSSVRDLLQILGTLLISGKLWGITESNWALITGIIMMLVPFIWSMFVHSEANAVAVVAEMKKTDVSGDGKIITLHDPKLVNAAKASATPLDMAA